MLIREHYEDRGAWLAARHYGIGASDASAIFGLSPWKSSWQLWKEKVGEPQTTDSIVNNAVILGTQLENPVREIFRIKHPELEVEHFPYDILYQDTNPWLRATLDGEITDKATGRKGVYEGKTATCIKGIDWARWQQQIPQHYFIQCLWQLNATNYDFVYLCAFLMNKEGDRCEYREYYIERTECEEDLGYIARRGREFWNYIETKTTPPMILSL